MGASDIVPGVSGGTMAFILGIYEELIDSIGVLASRRFWRAVVGMRLYDLLRIVNWPFLLALGLGILAAVVALSRGLEWLLVHQPVPVWSFFFGLVLASVVTVSRRIARWTAGLRGALAAGAAGAYLLVGALPAQTPETWWFLMLSGALAICAMILPGISGAFVLVLLGKYQFVLAAVNQRELLPLALVAAGAAIAVVMFSRFLSWLFRLRHDLTVSVLTGLMLGSLRKVWPWKVDVAWLRDSLGEYVLRHGERVVVQQRNVLPDTGSRAGLAELLTAAGLALAGFGLILVLERLAHRRGADTAPSGPR